MLELIGRLVASPARDGGILDLPFDEFADECADEKVATLLGEYARAHRGATLRHVLRDERFRRWLAVTPTSPLRRDIEAELVLVSQVLEAEESILPLIEAPRAAAVDDARTMIEWAEAAGVAARLRDAAGVLVTSVPNGPLRAMARQMRRTTIRDLLEGRVEDPAVRMMTAIERAAFASQAKAYVQAAVERAQADAREGERIAALAHVPSGEGARALVAALDEALARQGRPAGGMPFTDWTVTAEPVRITARTEIPAKASGRPRPLNMSFSLEDWRARPVGNSVVADSSAGRTAEMTRAFLGAVRRVLGDPSNAAYPALVRFLDEPAWERVLAKTRMAASGLEAGAAARDRGTIVWRIYKERPLSLEACFQYASERARLQQIGLDAILLGTFPVAPIDERVARALYVEPSAYDYRYYGSSRYASSALGPDERRDRLSRALSLLAGEPNVVTSGGEAAAVVEGDIEVALEGSDVDGYRLEFAVAGTPLSPRVIREALDEKGLFIHYEPAARTAFVSYPGSARARVLVALASEEAVFPATARQPLVARAVALVDVVPISLPSALVGEAVEADPRPLVRVVRPSVDTLGLGWLVRPVAGGPAFPSGKGPAQLLQEVGGRTAVAQRSLDEERARADALRAKLPAVVLARDGGRCEGMREVLEVVAILRAAAEAGDAVIEWPKNVPRVVGSAAWSKLRLVVSQQRDWFGVNGKVAIDGEEITLADLLAARRSGDPFIAVGPDRLVAIEKELEAKLDALEKITRSGAGGLALHPAAIPSLSELLDHREQVSGADSFWKLLERIDAATASEPRLPRGFAKVLRSYQVEGFRWMSRLAAWGAGACLADEMGLGKTVQTLALLVARKEAGPALVVAPTSVVPNWLAEAKRFAPGLRTVLHRGADRDTELTGLAAGTLVVTSYDVLVRDIEVFADVPFATVILDEAQAIKNGTTARARAARRLRGEFRLALTGTPIENRLGELHSLMEFLNPDFFGSEQAFRSKWVIPIERDQDSAQSAALARVIRPFILRRTKAAVLTELPARTEIVRTVEPSVAERRRYEAARQLALAMLAGADEEGRFRVLAEIMRLRRLACHPRLDDGASTIESSKLATFLELVTELKQSGHRALVFSQFTDHLALVEEALRARGIAYVYLDGKTPLAERTRRVKAFQDGEGDLFLISLKAGGTGLNLTAADTVIHLDPWWNPAVEDQASDRAHRMGQTRAVTVIRLIAEGTIEEAVVALHAEKRKLAESILDGAAASGKLSIAELGALIRHGEA